mgnify:FL=1
MNKGYCVLCGFTVVGEIVHAECVECRQVRAELALKLR